MEGTRPREFERLFQVHMAGERRFRWAPGSDVSCKGLLWLFSYICVTLPRLSSRINSCGAFQYKTSHLFRRVCLISW